MQQKIMGKMNSETLVIKNAKSEIAWEKIVLEYDEKRNYIRMDIDCDLTFRAADSDHFYQGHCTSLSGSGVAFVAEEQFDVGKGLEINIVPKSSVTPPMTAYVEVVRSKPLEKGQYEIAAVIRSIKGA